MTPKEKANELFLKYHNLWINGNSILAKQCALIAVDEVITAIENVFTKSVAKLNSTYRYWQEVKQEILKL